ncbi:hypothetical protein CAPTEDRAFT_221562 [Capitella teleta]|uniref:GATOR complex protein NPRL3 n=1 Tax=Capitella teleta TaxID=283909 RepID=R7V8W6_CAPTE|nr:hypothetical protein CAPTEDRAFT_221562 [Capitella teleta]|eukprot:ELU15283.1 hypothetical protein CAPTEDRAFT_221562 [Capitella teleta]
MDTSNPIGIFLVSSGSNGERLLFRYPDGIGESPEETSKNPKNNPYSVKITENFCCDDSHSAKSIFSNIDKGMLTGYADKDLANLLAVKAPLCGKKFEVKINEVLFVGFPLHIFGSNDATSRRQMSTLSSFNLVFALHGSSDESLIASYQDIAKHLVVGLRHEEERCGYLTQQKNIMWTIQDDVAMLPEDQRCESPFKIMLKKSQLAKQLKKVHDDVCKTGVVQLYINNWVHISVCLPHKVYNMSLPSDCGRLFKPEAVKKCLASLRPYHALLLMVDENSLSNSLPLDSSPSITRLLRIVSPLKNLQTLAADADLSLGQVFQIASHLVLWGKATIIYPLCESNVYVLGPRTNTLVNSALGEKFVEQFPGMSLSAIMAEFSLPSPLGEHRDVLGLPQQQAQEVKMVVWMLRQQLLLQLHTYVYLMPCGVPSQSQLTPQSGGNNSDLEIFLSGMKRASSASDVASVNSDELYPPKSPSIEITNEGNVITSETRLQWRLVDQHLSALTPEQRREILAVPAASNPEDLHLFAKLCLYFDGHHHLEEIMYYENVRRSQLLTLLDKFRSILITCIHEDKVTSFWNS